MKRFFSAAVVLLSLMAGGMAGGIAGVTMAHADDGMDAGLAGADLEVRGMVDDFVQQRFAERTERALNALIETGASVLKDKGFEEDANQMRAEWFLLTRRGVGLFDLGDHAPLNQWLAKTYAKLESKLGAKVMTFFRLDDIKIFNYAIPVVFSPSKWSMDEYRLHFVPFSSAVAYWISRLSCSLITTGWINWLCGTIAELPRYAVGKWIAPGLSDKIHKMANGVPSILADEIFDERKLDIRALLIRSREELLSTGALSAP